MEPENLSAGVEEFTCNVYRIGELLVDVGTGEDVMERIGELEEVGAVLVTHSHYDHVDNLEAVAEIFSPEVYCLSPERLPDTGLEAKPLQDGESFQAAGLEVEALHTPGHRDDHLCFLVENEILFSGDLVFAEGSFGRTDLEEGDRKQLIQSIRKVIERTDPSAVYPGHGDPVVEDVASSLRRSLENAEKRQPKYG